LVNYLGSGSVDLWRGDLLISDDPVRLSNGIKLPMVIAMNCLNGFFDDIYTESLASSLLALGVQLRFIDKKRLIIVAGLPQ
jgi:hypothetical protein